VTTVNSGGGAAVAVLTSIIVVALATTLVLPGRQTPQVITSFFTGFAGALKSAMGR
jgi:hypothetical protein